MEKLSRREQHSSEMASQNKLDLFNYSVMTPSEIIRTYNSFYILIHRLGMSRSDH